MGRGLHLHIEHRHPDETEWHHLCQILPGPINILLDLMVGMRPGAPITKHRGLPGDVSRTTLEAFTIGPDSDPTAYQNPQFYTPNWLTPDEFARAIEQANPHPYDGVEYLAALATLRQLQASGHQSRIVSWFD